MLASQTSGHEALRALLQRLVVGLLLVLFLIPEGYSLDLPALQDAQDGSAELRAGDLPSGVPEFKDPQDGKPGLAATRLAPLPRPERSVTPNARPLLPPHAPAGPCQPRAPPLPV